MGKLTLEQRITHLQSAIYTLRILRNEGVDLTSTIEQAESKLHELCKEAGWDDDKASMQMVYVRYLEGNEDLSHFLMTTNKRRKDK